LWKKIAKKVPHTFYFAKRYASPFLSIAMRGDKVYNFAIFCKNVMRRITVANHKSSEKRAKQEKTKRMTNKVKTAATRTAVKAVRDAVAKGDASAAKTLLVKAQSLLAKLAKSPAMKKQTAARKTSRLTKLVAGLK
jgi:small subunit ribosomal protein S20